PGTARGPAGLTTCPVTLVSKRFISVGPWNFGSFQARWNKSRTAESCGRIASTLRFANVSFGVSRHRRRSFSVTIDMPGVANADDSSDAIGNGPARYVGGA